MQQGRRILGRRRPSADVVNLLIIPAEGDDIAPDAVGRFALYQEPADEARHVGHGVFLQAEAGQFLATDADAVQVARDRRQWQADAAEQDVRRRQALGSILPAAEGCGMHC